MESKLEPPKNNFLPGVFAGVGICLIGAMIAAYFLGGGQKPAPDYLVAPPPAFSGQPVPAVPALPAQMPQTPAQMLQFLNNLIPTMAQDAGAADLYFARANAKFALGDVAGAVADLSQAIALNPQLAPAFFNRGVANINLARLAQAAADFGRAQTLFAQASDSKSAADAARALKAVQDYQKYAAANPRAQGGAASAAGQKPLPTPQVAMRSGPSLGNIAAAQANKSALSASLSGASASAPGGIMEKFRNAAAAGDMPGLDGLGDYQAAVSQAMADNKDKMAQAPKTHLDYKTEAMQKARAGDHAGAKEALDSAISLSPKSQDLYMDRANASLAQGDVKAASQDLDKLLEMNPNNAGAWLKKSQAQSMAGDSKGALASAKKAQELYGEQGNAPGAAAAQNEANRLEGRARVAQRGDSALQQLYTTATQNYEKGDFKAARDNFAAIAQQQPGEAGNHHNLGLANLQMGDVAAAKKNFYEAIERGSRESHAALAQTIMQDLQKREITQANLAQSMDDTEEALEHLKIAQTAMQPGTQEYEQLSQNVQALEDVRSQMEQFRNQ